MTRVRRRYIARRHRTKIRLFAATFRGFHSRLTRTTTQQKNESFGFHSSNRGKRQRSFHRLWITRINAVTHENRGSYKWWGREGMRARDLQIQGE